MNNLQKDWTRLRFPAMRAVFLFIVGIVLAAAWNTRAFSLLGPFQPWMEETNDLRQPGDIGGPMCISNAYRWDVPVVTYGFDPSFAAYFGTNGEAAVQSAIQTINALPPAPSLSPTNYPYNTIESFDTAAFNLLDLKSWTLSLLLEQMGLAQPTRYTYVLRQWNPVFVQYPDEINWPVWVFTNDISELNYDPQTNNSSVYLNNLLYTANIASQNGQNLVDIFPVDSEAAPNYAVADQALELGNFFTGLTYDDVGGLRFLFSTNNITYETLLSDVRGIGTNSFINGAWRPGINKISFVPQATNSSGGFLLTTNYFTDTYFSNGIPREQSLMRVTSQPDFLFVAGDVTSSVPGVLYFSRTGTTNWQNNAAANGNSGGAGPGVIQPPIEIIYNKLGEQYFSFGGYEQAAAGESPYLWATFNQTNAPVIYPVSQAGSVGMTVRMWLWLPGEIMNSFDWKPTALAGSQFALETSTNLVNWTTLFTVTNNSSVITYFNYIPANGSEFYRLVPQ